MNRHRSQHKLLFIFYSIIIPIPSYSFALIHHDTLRHMARHACLELRPSGIDCFFPDVSSRNMGFPPHALDARNLLVCFSYMQRLRCCSSPTKMDFGKLTVRHWRA